MFEDSRCNIITTPGEILSNIFEHNKLLFATILPLEEGAIKDFYLRTVCVQKTKIVEIEQKSRLQNNLVWKNERALRITASRAHELFTYKGQDWGRKLANFLTPSKYKSAAMVYGTKSEESARLCYATVRKCNVTKVGFVINADHPWLGCSPDGYVAEESKLIEIKCPYNGKQMPLCNMLHTVKYLDENFNLKKSHIYYTQIQISMAVCNVNCCDFIIYSKYDNKCFITTIPINVEFVENVVHKLKYVYFNKLLPLIFDKNNQINNLV